MYDLTTKFLERLLFKIEILTGIVAIYYLFKSRFSYWKWFCLFILVVVVSEIYWHYNISNPLKKYYYAYFGIPIQYIFFYWLYAVKSLKQRSLFYFFTVIYLFSFIPFNDFFKEDNIVNSLNLTVGTVLLSWLVVQEFKKQINLDNILEFKENKMFYINVGVIVFYIGNYPFFAFYDTFHKAPFMEVGDWYYMYFRISVCLLYISYIASLIWGKFPLK